MTNLVIQHAAEPTGETPDGTLRIGRGADNDVVLDHPTVSRHHAVIERVAGEYFLTDLGSKNHTRVGGRTVRERRPLQHGERIRFGQVRVTFIISDDGQGTASLDRADADAPEPGILFDCTCGTRLWAHREAAGGMVTCGRCKAEVVVPTTSAKSDSGETVAGFSVAAPSAALAAPVQTGTCSICQWQTSTEDRITICPACGLTFHSECWTENRGCSAYGCSQVNSVAPPTRRQRPEQPGPIGRSDPESGEAVIENAPIVEPPRQGLPIEHALLAASVVGGLLGLLAFGALSIASLVTSVAMLARGRGNRKVVLISGALSLVGAVAGAFVSAMWWLGWSPGVSL